MSPRVRRQLAVAFTAFAMTAVLAGVSFAVSRAFLLPSIEVACFALGALVTLAVGDPR